MAKEKFFVDKRFWLNPKKHSDSGAIHYYVSGYQGDPYVDASLTVWDCSRKTTLDFSFHDEQSAKQRAKKIDMLINALQEMKEAMGKAYNNSGMVQEEIQYDIPIDLEEILNAD